MRRRKEGRVVGVIGEIVVCGGRWGLGGAPKVGFEGGEVGRFGVVISCCGCGSSEGRGWGWECSEDIGR